MAHRKAGKPTPDIPANPLLEALAPEIPFSKLPEALVHEPLDSIDWRATPPESRESFLTLQKHHYWPVAPQLEVASDIQRMLRGGLWERNPLSAGEQRRINMLAQANNAESIVLQSLPSPAGGAILAAITCMGKSSVVKRALQVFAPDQIVVHGPDQQCGWSRLVQVAYLLADAPPNATRHGLFSAIIGALDRLLGTDYTSVLKRQKGIDAAAIYVAKTLSNHRVGLLVIDENQEETLADGQWGYDFVRFFLGLMNLGIPTLLVGNPLAFSAFDENAQLTSRFVTHGWSELSPAIEEEDLWWREQFLVGAMRFNLCEDPLPIEVVDKKSSDHTGGIPGVFSALWKEATLTALRRGGTSARMDVTDIDAAASSPRFRKLAKIAKSVLEKGVDHRFRDIPDKSSARECQAPNMANSAANAEEMAASLKRLENQLKRKEAADKKKKEMDKERLETLTEDDLRKGSDAMAIMASGKGSQSRFDV